MKAWEEHAKSCGHRVSYIDAHDARAATASLFEYLSAEGVDDVHVDDPVDYLLMRRLQRESHRTEVRLHVGESRLFLDTRAEVDDYFQGRRRMLMHDFYVRRRKREGILLDGAGQPLGGKWSFDEENRKRIPPGTPLPPPPAAISSPYVVEAGAYVANHFPGNPGKAAGFCFPVTRGEALEVLDQFLHQRFHRFGTYQDAMISGESWLFHSLLSAPINAGLIQPREVVQRSLDFAARNDISLNHTEGFIRQVIGWREYIRGVYVHHGVAERTRNYWNHHRSLPASFWNGTTGIPPVDDAICRVLRDGYTHHIDRLMILGNFMLLCEFDPDEVYRWFMALFIDAYDWVMVPNVYGMSQFADGGIMSTKPYISGSAYVLKMSNYAKGEWTEIWDALFWRFISVHRDFFLSNPRLGMMVRTWDKMAPDRRGELLDRASAFLGTLGDGEKS